MSHKREVLQDPELHHYQNLHPFRQPQDSSIHLSQELAQAARSLSRPPSLVGTRGRSRPGLVQTNERQYVGQEPVAR